MSGGYFYGVFRIDGFIFIECLIIERVSLSSFVGEGSPVKSNMVYKLCKHMVYKFKSA